MTIYNIIVGFISAAYLFFSLYNLFTVIFIHKRIFDKHFYFMITSFVLIFFNSFQILQTLPFTDEQYLFFHRLRLCTAVIIIPFGLLTFYSCYFVNGKKSIPIIQLLFSIICLFFSFNDSALSIPIHSFEINLFGSNMIFHAATSKIVYKIWGISAILSLILSVVHFFISKDKKKRITFVIVVVITALGTLNDTAISSRLISSIPLSFFSSGMVLTFIFIEFLFEDKKNHFAVIDLTKQLQIEKDQAIHRLKIMEIYTRKSLVESIEKGDDPTKFQPNNIQIATLFTDIRDFTGISEGLKPLEVVDLLNSYFNRMNSTIIKYNGEIDKLMGDCIMALFKNPDDALKSAIEMRYELAKFNKETSHRPSPKEREEEFPLLRGGLGRGINNGIGLNYGEVIIGNIGSESKMDYTVVGDIVNTASRLEALTKYYKTPLIISEDLKNQLIENYRIRFLDEVLVKGKSHPMKIYEVFDFELDKIKETKENNQKSMEEAFSYYQSGEFLKANQIYERLSQTLTASQSLTDGDPVIYFFSERCRNLQIRKEAGLLEGWNGVFEFMDK
jgi:class 3 adenylate cyclase